MHPHTPVEPCQPQPTQLPAKAAWDLAWLGPQVDSHGPMSEGIEVCPLKQSNLKVPQTSALVVEMVPVATQSLSGVMAHL